MPKLTPFVTALLLALAAAACAPPAPAAVTRPTPPAEQFGAAIGDDYFLATYTELEAYWQRLDRESDRMTLVDIGRTEEGRRQWMAVVSAPDNLRRLDHFRGIARRLALADGVSEAEAAALAREGRAIVAIAGGLHADEVLGAQQLVELVYQLVSGEDDETRRIRRDVIVLVVHANPDGHEMVADWYMRRPVPATRTLDGLPRPYQKYVGHDNNRDFYMATQAETRNVARVLYQEWFPQVVYDHHQSAPDGTVMFAPPFDGPVNYLLHPLVRDGVERFGVAMQARFAAEGRGGVTTRGGGEYSAWWNGGLRTTANFHNQIGLLTETIGSPTPIEIPHVPERQRASSDLPRPVEPGPFRFRDAVAYSMSANRAILDTASRGREALLRDVYVMGRDAIRHGSTDHWTARPGRVDGRGPHPPRTPASRDARAYAIPADQPDFATAVKFVQALRATGVVVHRATAPFTAGTARYPAGSFVVRTAQAFRPHVLDMFEPQDHPGGDPQRPGAPVPLYDGAGWTLALQMGVVFDRLLDAVDGPFEVVAQAAPPASTIDGKEPAAGYVLSHAQNDAFTAAIRLLEAGEAVWWPADRRFGGFPDGTGAMFVPAGPRTRTALARAIAGLGVAAMAVPDAPSGAALRLRRVRVGVWDAYGGTSASGWVRWLLEQFEMPFEIVHAQTIDAADLRSRFDVLVFPGEASLAAADVAPAIPPDLPAPYRSTTGVLTTERSVPALDRFVRAGGTIVTIGPAARLATALGVPLENALVERLPDGSAWPLASDRFFVPGSVVRARVDTRVPLGYGFARDVDVYFDSSPVFQVTPLPPRPPRVVSWYEQERPLRSGLAVGQERLRGGVAVADIPVGLGRVIVLAPEVTFRGQAHGTFKFLFNALLLAGATPAP